MTPQLVTGVDFVGVPTRNLEAAVEFYGETLGLPRSVYLKERNYAEFAEIVRRVGSKEQPWT
jgi:catechol 2,3-dioxygenase-like lactoylglutathione lyase family enzyme